MLSIQAVEAELVETPLRTQFRTSRDAAARTVSRRVAVTMRFSDGTADAGESTPVAYVTGETCESVTQAVAVAGERLSGMDADRLGPIAAALRDALPAAPSARCGVEMAAWRGFARRHGVSLWQLWGGVLRDVRTDITLSVGPDIVATAQDAAARGFGCFKVKVGNADPQEDAAAVRAVHGALPGSVFRLDANQGFEPDAALAFLSRLLDAGVPIEMVEQPVAAADLTGLDYVARRSPVPIIADEAAHSPADVLRLVSETAVHGVNAKLMKAGIAGALDIVAIARAAGRRLMIGCMLESRLGISVALSLACGMGCFDYVDLDSHALLREEGENPYFREEGASLGILEPATR